MSHPIPFEIRQDLTDQAEAWRKSLPPPPVPAHLLGAKFRLEDPRDWDLSRDAKVALQLQIGFPDTFDNSRYLTGTYDQGAEPSCVSHTAAGMSSGHEMQERSRWLWFDGHRMHRETGDVNQGRWPEQIFGICKDRGMPLANSEERYRIEAYAFVDKGANWADTVKAAVAAGKFLGLAMLLPSYFSYESEGSITSGYHEVLICGYRPNAFLIKNSWGEGWGKAGFGWIPIPFLTQANYQNGYVFAHALTDQRTGPPPPPPPDDAPREIIRLVNNHRQSIGRAPLAEHPLLMKSTAAKCRDMGEKGYFAHDHEGMGPLQWMQSAGMGPLKAWGENLTAAVPDPGTAPEAGLTTRTSAVKDGVLLSSETTKADLSTPGGAFTNWMNSPGHRANMESAAFTHLGVGHELVTPSPFGHYWAQHFAHPSDEPPPPPDTLKVTGINPSTLRGGERFLVQGQGFGQSREAITLSWQNMTLPKANLSGDGIESVAPPVNQETTGPLTVTVAGLSAVSPVPLTVLPMDNPPPPPPAKRATVTGKAEGDGVEQLAVGSSYNLTDPPVGLTLTQIVWDDDHNPPPPPPGDLTVDVKLWPHPSGFHFFTIKVSGRESVGVTLSVLQDGQAKTVGNIAPLLSDGIWRGAFRVSGLTPGPVVFRVEGEGQSGEWSGAVP